MNEDGYRGIGSEHRRGQDPNGWPARRRASCTFLLVAICIFLVVVIKSCNEPTPSEEIDHPQYRITDPASTQHA